MLTLPEYTKRLQKDLRLESIRRQTFHQYHLQQKKKSEKSEDETKSLSKENETMKKANGKLNKEIEQLTKTKNRYQGGLVDHGNFTHPNKGQKKPKGGQRGHADTKKDHERDYESFEKIRVYAVVCGGCGTPLSRCQGIKEKTLLDIDLNPHIVQLMIQAERQWCGRCHTEVRATHPQSLPFTEYGITTFMVVMYLRFKGKQSVRTIAASLQTLFGLPITKSGVGTLLEQAKQYLQDKYEQLQEAIRGGEIMYNDETGWMVRGKPAWMWIMTTPDKKSADGSIEAGITVYVAAESKGKSIFTDMYGNSHAYSMHDGNPSYESITGRDKSLYCWSHVTRFAFEETVKLPPEHAACIIRDRLVDLYQNIRKHPTRTQAEKEAILRTELDSILSIQSPDETVNNILLRITTQKEGLILALLLTEDGTNNLAEREFRQLVISRTISYGSDTYGGMETTAILSSIVQTLSRDKSKSFFPTLASSLQEGIQKKFPQHKHIPVFDT